MDQTEIARYCALMEQIKGRVAAVDFLAAQPMLQTPYQLEATYLHYRKILELIAFASLVSNLEKFSSTYQRFTKYWNAAQLLRDLERINGDFYPQPQLEQPSADPGVKRHLEPKKKGFLTKSDFLELYGRTGDILHERNPYAKYLEDNWFEQNTLIWKNKIIELLNTHMIRLAGMSHFYLVQMQADDGKVHHYTFVPVER